jgi:hypothetical protein
MRKRCGGPGGARARLGTPSRPSPAGDAGSPFDDPRQPSTPRPRRISVTRITEGGLHVPLGQAPSGVRRCRRKWPARSRGDGVPREPWEASSRSSSARFSSSSLASSAGTAPAGPHATFRRVGAGEVTADLAVRKVFGSHILGRRRRGTWYPSSHGSLGYPGLVTVQTTLMAVRAFVVHLSEHSPESLVLVWLARQRVDELSEEIAAFRPPLECLARDRLSIFLVGSEPAAEHLTVIRPASVGAVSGSRHPHPVPVGSRGPLASTGCSRCLR